jgi:NADP-dependent 3-hydroxy acid dehydrogenase YdfG
VEVCRQLAQAGIQASCAARALERAEHVAESLRGDGDVHAARLDVAGEDSILDL